MVLFQAILRKKIQESKRLDLELQNEKHLRQEVEYDLEQTNITVKEKGMLIHCILSRGMSLLWLSS